MKGFVDKQTDKAACFTCSSFLSMTPSQPNWMNPIGVTKNPNFRSKKWFACLYATGTFVAYNQMKSTDLPEDPVTSKGRNHGRWICSDGK